MAIMSLNSTVQFSMISTSHVQRICLESNIALATEIWYSVIMMINFINKIPVCTGLRTTRLVFDDGFAVLSSCISFAIWKLHSPAVINISERWKKSMFFLRTCFSVQNCHSEQHSHCLDPCKCMASLL